MICYDYIFLILRRHPTGLKVEEIDEKIKANGKDFAHSTIMQALKSKEFRCREELWKLTEEAGRIRILPRAEDYMTCKATLIKALELYGPGSIEHIRESCLQKACLLTEYQILHLLLTYPNFRCMGHIWDLNFKLNPILNIPERPDQILPSFKEMFPVKILRVVPSQKMIQLTP
ncbi:hypothetical protein N7466_007302 [Penicillium verhagenii]|uniref:uncharacterized protein n=1 Tax=Penicillium verhagenii TaxID=1562060 RepID=UPI0025450911|nr:uncharacterized protein N7466_007302 [Penicillium verhagenii]KAJ5928346.1 hypothetical protein N7466_007302 [Penicillium verhagenii]